MFQSLRLKFKSLFKKRQKGFALMDALSLVLVVAIGFGGVYAGITSAVIVVTKQERRIEQYIADFNQHEETKQKFYTFK